MALLNTLPPELRAEFAAMLQSPEFQARLRGLSTDLLPSTIPATANSNIGAELAPPAPVDTGGFFSPKGIAPSVPPEAAGRISPRELAGVVENTQPVDQAQMLHNLALVATLLTGGALGPLLVAAKGNLEEKKTAQVEPINRALAGAHLAAQNAALVGQGAEASAKAAEIQEKIPSAGTERDAERLYKKRMADASITTAEAHMLAAKAEFIRATLANGEKDVPKADTIFATLWEKFLKGGRWTKREQAFIDEYKFLKIKEDQLAKLANNLQGITGGVPAGKTAAETAAIPPELPTPAPAPSAAAGGKKSSVSISVKGQPENIPKDIEAALMAAGGFATLGTKKSLRDTSTNRKWGYDMQGNIIRK